MPWGPNFTEVRRVGEVVKVDGVSTPDVHDIVATAVTIAAVGSREAFTAQADDREGDWTATFPATAELHSHASVRVNANEIREDDHGIVRMTTWSVRLEIDGGPPIKP